MVSLSMEKVELEHSGRVQVKGGKGFSGMESDFHLGWEQESSEGTHWVEDDSSMLCSFKALKFLELHLTIDDSDYWIYGL